MIEELCSQIWERPEFRNEYQALIRSSLVSDLDLGGDLASAGLGHVGRLLQCATHFADSAKTQYKVAAYRIAASCWKLYRDEYPNLSDVALVVFERLGNFPAAGLMFENRQLPSSTTLPARLWYEVLDRREQNTLWLGDGEIPVTLTDFQQRLWASLSAGRSSAVTAPTSSGKSFALQRFLAVNLASTGGWGLYIVPTRALIGQTADSLREVFQSLAPGKLGISTQPVPPSELGHDSGVYVLTQERLFLLLDSVESPRFKIAVIDEAQMIGDGGRGVLLQSVLESLLARIPDIQLLFGSPFTENPEIFGKLLARSDMEVVSDDHSPVAQNLIYLDTNKFFGTDVEISASIESDRFDIGNKHLGTMVTDDEQTLAVLSWEFGARGQNLVYAGGPAACEEIADKLAQLATGSSEQLRGLSADELTGEFADFVREHIHSKYALARTLKHRVGFHYGRMPALIRRGVERLFIDGILTHLVCTSTLLHGVNLPAKNLFLLNPTKGRDWEDASDIPISGVDFWNLAGRAGRMGKEFEGNVYIINRDRWMSNPIAESRDQEIRPSLEASVLNEHDSFLNYLNNTQHASGKQEAFENSFVKLFNDLRAQRLDRTLERIHGGADGASLLAIKGALEQASDLVTLPVGITERHVNISVFRQQEMFDYLLGKVRSEGPGRFIPLHPLRPWDDVLANLGGIMKRIHTRFERKPGKDKSQFYFAPLALRWMRGEPLRRMIEEAESYNQEHGLRRNIGTVIRNVMGAVEKDLRFRYVKYISCYADILAEVLRKTGNEQYIASISPLSLFLELGASSISMISLIGLGLSRTSAALVADISVRKDLDRYQAKKFLLSRDWAATSLPRVVSSEVESVVALLA